MACAPGATAIEIFLEMQGHGLAVARGQDEPCAFSFGRIQISRRHFGPLLLCLEQAYRHALENHVYRHPRLGLSVIINETWYKANP
jgi:hypothetical protein